MTRAVAAPSELTVVGGAPLRGRLRVPGCKGISHRAVILGGPGGRSVDGTRTRGRRRCGVHDLGARRARRQISVSTPMRSSCEGLGFDGLREPDTVLDCGNSGTTMRMMAGLLAGRDFLSALIGDESLSARPMRRVLDPIGAMGAHVDGRSGGTRAPITVRGGSLRGGRHELATASGQVKTALILAGLQADGTTEIVEPAPSRDHTERMLRALGVPIDRPDPTTVRVTRGEQPVPFELTVPGDPSSASFFVVGACITPGSDLVIEAVSVNPARIAYIDVLRRMGADIDVVVTGEQVGEPVGDITVRAGRFRPPTSPATNRSSTSFRCSRSRPRLPKGPRRSTTRRKSR